MNNVVYVVDDDEVLCKALKWLLESANLKVKTFYSAVKLLEEYDINWQGCLLIDVRMPDMSGLQLQENLIALGNTIPIIMLTGHGDISMAVRALKAGAVDFITKPFNDQNLLEQIQKVFLKNTNNSYIASMRQRYKRLSSREQEVMAYVIEGKMNKVIADKLNISSKTVEVHRANIMHKMEVKSLAELVRIHCSIQMNNNFL